MKKRFIILIDFSEYSGNLIKYAFGWSKLVGAELLLVHQTIVLAPALTDNNSRQEIIQIANHRELKKLKLLARDLIPQTVKISFSVSEINLQLSLNKFLAEPFDNLIFTGLKGSGIFKKIFIGSVALQVIDNIKNIVVALPKEIAIFSQEKIFVAVTIIHPLNILELHKFLNFINKDNTSITFFYLAKPNEKTVNIEKLLRDLTSLFAGTFKINFAIYEGKDPFQDIRKVINNKEEEILIVQKGSRLWTDQIFRKFLINELVFEGQTPLVVLP